MVDYTFVQVIQALVTLILAIIALVITIWLAYKSPQAQLANIQIKERIRMQREDHYIRLDQHVFRPFSSLVASAPTSTVLNGRKMFRELRLTYNLDPIRNSRFYPDALKHLQKDYPNLEEDIKRLEKEISKLNNDVETHQQKIEEIVLKKLSALVTVAKEFPVQENSVFLPNVLTILEGYWSVILYTHIELQRPLEKVLSELKPLEVEYPRRIEQNQKHGSVRTC